MYIHTHTHTDTQSTKVQNRQNVTYWLAHQLRNISITPETRKLNILK